MNRIIKMLLSRKEFVLYSFMRIMVMLLGLVSKYIHCKKDQC
jgi:hypothetical protein